MNLTLLTQKELSKTLEDLPTCHELSRSLTLRVHEGPLPYVPPKEGEEPKDIMVRELRFYPRCWVVKGQPVWAWQLETLIGVRALTSEPRSRD